MWDPTDVGTEIKDLVLPTGKVVAQFLHRRRNGAKLTEILSFVRNKFRDAHPSQLNHNVASSLDAATTWGFLERKGSRFVEPGKKGKTAEPRSPPSERCRRRRSRRRYRRIKRRRCCCRKGKRRYRRRRRSRRRRRRC